MKQDPQSTDPHPTVFFATTNPDKVKDYQIVFGPLGVDLRALDGVLDVAETGATLLANARDKALANSRHYPDRLIMATDGGVTIPFLGDSWNHVLTRRLGGRDPEGTFTDRQRAEMLLKLMAAAKTDQERELRWDEAVVLAYGGKSVFELVQGSTGGTLLRHLPDDFQETGYWIGYLWYNPTLKKTYMSMTAEEKLKSSAHKSKLAEQLRGFPYGRYRPAGQA